MTRILRAAVCAAAFWAGAAPAQTTSSKADLEAVQRAVHVCAACHGEGGRSANQRYPSLAGQMREYTIRQLKDFRSQSRAETDLQGYMWGISALLTDDVIEGLADHYAQQAPRPGTAANPKLLTAGRVIFEKGIAAQGVLACASCHGDKAEGTAGFPRLAGQHASYLVRQLKVFRTPLRPHGVVMKKESASLSEPQMRAVAAYIQSL